MATVTQAIDPLRFRQVLGQYPTGVCAVCALDADGDPIGMVVGSFTSVSLDPPLVAFLPDRKSSTWARMSSGPRFCVNVLSADQEGLCRILASKDPKKFAEIPYRLSPLGSPILEGVVAWIDCEVHDVTAAGDHYLVQGMVRELEVETGDLPLLFFQGGYGRFSTSSIVSVNLGERLSEQLRIIELARCEMECIAADTEAQCVAQTRLGDEIVVAASAGHPGDHAPPILLGQRAPFVAPFGAVFAAHLPDKERETWLAAMTDAEHQNELREELHRVQQRGYAVSLATGFSGRIITKLQAIAAAAVPATPDAFDEFVGAAVIETRTQPEFYAAARLISAPVYDASGAVVLSLSLRGFPVPATREQYAGFVERLRSGARAITAQVGGQPPHEE